VAEGYTHKEAADMLAISVKTVIAHQTNIGEKLGIHTRAGLIKFAIQKGIIKIEMDA
jgi:DNA-binding NarL/FixJ family response regulator